MNICMLTELAFDHALFSSTDKTALFLASWAFTNKEIHEQTNHATDFVEWVNVLTGIGKSIHGLKVP